MRWIQTEPEMERRKFVHAALRREVSMSELCERFGISRKTGHKMQKRHADAGLPGLRDASRAPTTHPNQTPPEQDAAILRVRKAFPTWGSKKILWKLDRERLADGWQARSTVDEILRRAGVMTEHGRRPRRQPTSLPRVEALAPNDVWPKASKVWFRVGDETLCDPLTIHDVHSRASLVCQAMVEPRSNDVPRRLEEAFGGFGLPKYMLSDGGPPFGSNRLGRLSRLRVWLVRLGVTPVPIEPVRPDQNGWHECFHQTLKAETAQPPRSSIRAQQ
jgi:transposase InsO family protein